MLGKGLKKDASSVHCSPPCVSDGVVEGVNKEFLEDNGGIPPTNNGFLM